MIHTLPLEKAPKQVTELIRIILQHNDFLYLTRDGVPCVVVIPVHGQTHHMTREVDRAPRTVAALIEAVEEHGDTMVLSRSGHPLIALVPYSGSLGREELEHYRHRLRARQQYRRCVSEWGYDPDYDDEGA